MRIIHMQTVGSPPVTQGLLNQALSFYNGGSRCMADVCLTPLVTNAPMTPAIVCFAFAAEMYFKLLYAIGLGTVPRGHGLAKLFSGLPQEIQSAVIEAYGDSDLSSHIQDANEAFVQWRYQHEHETLTVNLTALMGVSKACHRVACQLEPELEASEEKGTLDDPW